MLRNEALNIHISSTPRKVRNRGRRPSIHDTNGMLMLYSPTSARYGRFHRGKHGQNDNSNETSNGVVL